MGKNRGREPVHVLRHVYMHVLVFNSIWAKDISFHFVFTTPETFGGMARSSKAVGENRENIYN